MTQFASTLYPQTNPTNPILTNLRVVWDRDAAHFLASNAHRSVVRGDWNYVSTVAQRLHAARVLKRLASLTG